MFAKNTRLMLGIGGLALLVSACGRDEPGVETSAALADGVLLPAYAQWHQSNQRLAMSGAAFCDGAEDLAALRQGFVEAQTAWSRLQAMMVGPLGEGNLAWQVQFWPDKKNLVARQVRTLLQNPAQPLDIEKGSVVVQGLTAYEYVVYDPEIDLQDSDTRVRYCPLIVAIGEHQQALSGRILEQWQADGMTAQLSRFPNERYADGDEALGDVMRVQVTALDGLKKKLGQPLGRPGQGIPQPYQAEAWRSGRSLASIGATVEGARALWQGANGDGLRSRLEDQALAERIDAAYGAVSERLAKLQAPLSELLATEDGRERLNALYDELNVLHRLHQGELARALGIQIGFNAHDGD
ncbi:imelysin family protein [Stutzerimonas tarimensis]|uniref:Imelysin family protein n=1 Tax=Stutzerimonas tarimensis TaxID=1507735 RepID=A0ABV7T2B2_9GAMM